jgi:pimeloyl-ACP methyl ester carboxylesterase
MLAAYYALLYPDATQQLVMIDPVGLEDWSAKGVPPISVEQWYAHDRETTADSIRRYQTATFYANRWEARYEPWVQMLAGMYRGPGRAEVSWDSALLYDMILTEPVIYRFGQINVPTLLMIGDRDNTAIGKEYAAPDVRVRLGQYSELGKAAAAAIPNAQLVEFPDLGHAPQLSDPDAFHKALLNGLAVR